MNDGGMWRRVYCLEWHEAALQGLTNDERVIYFYTKTGDQSTSVGIFRMSTAVAVEAFGHLTTVEFDYRLDRVCQAFAWRFDPVTRVLWIPSWIHDNPPQSPNVCKSWRKLLANVPDCELKVEAATAIHHYLKTLPQSFREAFGSLPKDFGNSKAKPKSKTEAYQEAGSRGSGNQGIRESESRHGLANERRHTNRPTEPQATCLPISWQPHEKHSS